MKQRNITDIQDKTKKIACLGCAIQQGEVESLGGSFLDSQYFDARQDYEIPIPGFIILASKRHLQSVDEFTEKEQQDFIKSLCRLRLALRKVLDIKVEYLIQEEDFSDHFHIWIFPHYEWMTKIYGQKIQSVRPIMEYARENLKTTSNLKKVNTTIQKLKQFLVSNN